MTANKIIFGITGQTGSGKSYISDIFRKKGVTVFDSDKIAHEVMEAGKPCLLELKKHFGDTIIAEDGSLIRPALAKIVFSDPEELGILNRISHKYIKEEIEHRISLCDTLAAAIDGAVIIGSPVEELCSFLVGVTAPDDIRLARIIARDGISEEAALARMKAQKGKDFYNSHCKYIIENDNIADLSQKITHILEKENIKTTISNA